MAGGTQARIRRFAQTSIAAPRRISPLLPSRAHLRNQAPPRRLPRPPRRQTPSPHRSGRAHHPHAHLQVHGRPRRGVRGDGRQALLLHRPARPLPLARPPAADRLRRRARRPLLRRRRGHRQRQDRRAPARALSRYFSQRLPEIPRRPHPHALSQRGERLRLLAQRGAGQRLRIPPPVHGHAGRKRPVPHAPPHHRLDRRLPRSAAHRQDSRPRLWHRRLPRLRLPAHPPKTHLARLQAARRPARPRAAPAPLRQLHRLRHHRSHGEAEQGEPLPPPVPQPRDPHLRLAEQRRPLVGKSRPHPRQPAVHDAEGRRHSAHQVPRSRQESRGPLHRLHRRAPHARRPRRHHRAQRHRRHHAERLREPPPLSRRGQPRRRGQPARRRLQALQRREDEHPAARQKTRPPHRQNPLPENRSGRF